MNSNPLDLSIKHWQEIVDTPSWAHMTIKMDSDSCALCRAFNHDELPESRRCVGCPVMKRTGHPFCRKSPWKSAYKQWLMLPNDWPGWQQAAKAELTFLKSLRA